MAVFSLSAWTNRVSYAAVAGMQDGMVEQPRRRSRGRARLRSTETPNSAAGRGAALGVGSIGQVGHRDQFEAAVEDAEHLVALEVELST